jgi:hypothetical protein
MSEEEGKAIKLFMIDYNHDIPIVGGYSFDDYSFIPIDRTSQKFQISGKIQ